MLEKGAIDDGYGGDTKEYTVVGFTQRTYRRAWLNLPEILDDCNNASFENTIYVEINAENSVSPFTQLLLQRSLDVVMGVHGAQLTQAVLLPDHAHVLELLPWITDYIRSVCRSLSSRVCCLRFFTALDVADVGRCRCSI